MYRLLTPILCLVATTTLAQEPGTEICGTLSGSSSWTAAGSPYRVTCTSLVPRGSTLGIGPGVEVRFAAGVRLDIEGSIQAQGDSENRILFTRDADAEWDGLSIDHQSDGEPRGSTLRFVDLRHAGTLLRVLDTSSSRILVEDCRFDLWSNLALRWDSSQGLEIRRSEFGMDTPIEAAESETINGARSSVLLERSEFGRRRGYRDVIDLADTDWSGPVPTIRDNIFHGGDDDAIDFDNTDGWIIGNVIMNFWPTEGAHPSANGGGITGDQGSAPVILNNTVYRCFHGIGFKNGAQPLIAQNLVLDCHVGVTLYKDECSKEPPAATLLNNIVWNNRHFETDALQNVVLNGTWWPAYCQDSTDQATADLRFSIVEGGFSGEGNQDSDPRITDAASGNFSLGADSPALDAGFGGPLVQPGVDPGALLEEFLRDQHAAPRFDLECVANSGSGDLDHVDLGPLERQSCPPGQSFVRGDSNRDGAVDLADAVHILLGVFRGNPIDCPDASDANDDGAVNIADPNAVLNLLFKRGPRLPEPYPVAGNDPDTGDGLGCGEA